MSENTTDDTTQRLSQLESDIENTIATLLAREQMIRQEASEKLLIAEQMRNFRHELTDILKKKKPVDIQSLAAGPIVEPKRWPGGTGQHR